MRAKIAKEKNKRTTVVQSAKTDKSRVQGAHSQCPGSGAEQKGSHNTFAFNIDNPAALDGETILNNVGSIRNHMHFIEDPI